MIENNTFLCDYITFFVLVPPITAFTSNSQSLLIYWLSVAHHPVTRDNPLPLTHRHSVRIFVPYFGWFHTTVLWGRDRQQTGIQRLRGRGLLQTSPHASANLVRYSDRPCQIKRRKRGDRMRWRKRGGFWQLVTQKCDPLCSFSHLIVLLSLSLWRLSVSRDRREEGEVMARHVACSH